MIQPPYTVIIRQDDGHYVALCLEFNIASQGETREEARRNVDDAMVEYLAYMKDIGAEDQIAPVPFDVLREFLLEGSGKTWRAPLVAGAQELSPKYIKLVLRQLGFTDGEIAEMFS